VLITRIVSKPGVNLLCVDLGHKSVASEMPQPRAIFPQLSEFRIVTHSEEHMVIETKESDKWEVGDCLYGIPWHICPTMALHESALIVEDGHVVDEWTVLARKRKITI
jgi:D-serine deaminase-like pyridoxal phosphate-dependent protein